MPKPSPTGVKRKVRQSGPTRRPREREHLTPKEVERVIEAAREGRWGLRDATLLLMLFRTVSGLPRRSDSGGNISTSTRASCIKNGLDGDHRLRGVEIRALRRMRPLNPHPAGDYVFTSEPAPLSARAPCSSCSTARPRAPASNI